MLLFAAFHLACRVFQHSSYFLYLVVGYLVVKQFREGFLELLVSNIRHLLGRHRFGMFLLKVLVSRHRIGAFCEEVSPRVGAAAVLDRWIENIGGFLRNFRPQVLQGTPELDLDRLPGYFGYNVDRSVTVAGIVAAVYYGRSPELGFHRPNQLLL